MTRGRGGSGAEVSVNQCCDNVYMVELFYVDMSRYNTS